MAAQVGVKHLQKLARTFLTLSLAGESCLCAYMYSARTSNRRPVTTDLSLYSLQRQTSDVARRLALPSAAAAERFVVEQVG